MKHIIQFFALMAILYNSSFSAMTLGSITHQIITSTSVTRTSMYIISDMQNYTTGGLIFTYPIGTFSSPPLVQISVQPIAAHPATETYVAEISSNSAAATTVMVYLVNAGVVSEAPNGSVQINLLAITDPV